MAPIRICHLIDSLNIGGAQEVVLDLAGPHASGAVDYSIITLRADNALASEFVARGVDLHVLHPWRSGSVLSPLRLRRLIRELRPDVLNLHLEGSTLLGLWYRSLLPVQRVLVTLHALRSQLPRWFYPLFSLRIGQADAFVVEDRIAEQDVRAAGAPAANVHYIPLGTNYHEEAFGASSAGLREEFGIPPDAPVALNIARMVPGKGQDLLLQAFARLAQRLPTARLLIVGSGRLEKDLRALRARLGLEEQVLFAGFRRDLARFYAAADAFCMSARDENMGVVIYQAMVMGLPVVAGTAGSIAEVVVPDETGLLAPAEDTETYAERLLSVLTQRETLGRALGGAGRQRVLDHFTTARMVQAYEALYADLASARQR